MSKSDEKKEAIVVATDQVNISEDVFVAIVNKAVSTIQEVHIASGNIVSGIANIFGKKTSDSPIRIEGIVDNKLVIHVNVMVKFGVYIPKVSIELQEIIKSQVSEFTGHDVDSVNVYVCGILTEDQEKEILDDEQA